MSRVAVASRLLWRVPRMAVRPPKTTTFRTLDDTRRPGVVVITIAVPAVVETIRNAIGRQPVRS